MKRGKLICSGITAGFWSFRCIITLAIAGMALLPAKVSDAGWLSDIVNGPAKAGKSPKHLPTPKPRTVKVSALKPVALNPSALRSVATQCDSSKFRIVLDVGHTAEAKGAISARNVAEFAFNLRLAQQIEEKLKAVGFAEARLLVTEGEAKPSLVKRVAAANKLQANLFLSIHHDSVPDKLLEDWEFEGKKSHFSDRFSGYSVFVSRRNAYFKTSLLFAELIGKAMRAQGFDYAKQYTQPIMGRYQHPLLNKENGVYGNDKLIVLGETRMAAALLEAGSIINRDEELKMDSPERRDIISSVVAAAVREFCESRWTGLGPL
jgi:N-acetylmuramoyl-L-alanine amidase